MQATSIGTVAVTVILLGAFLYVRAGVAHLGTQMLDRIEISVYARDGDGPAQIAKIRSVLRADRRIAALTFVPKREGLRQLRAELKGQIDTSILTTNPLPDKFRVRLHNPDEVAAVAASIRKIPGVGSVDYGAQLVARLLKLGTVARRAGIAVIVLFLLTAGIIIANTIRLTVFARRREISIMQLVGATNMYIRMPFICEGLLAGVLGALVAIGVLALARSSVEPKLIAALPWLQLRTLRIDLLELVAELLVVGGAVGIVASWISVGRHLRT